jgi:UDP-N-acetylglucosamine 4,6-dehydratase
VGHEKEQKLRVCVTGVTGTFGREFTRRMLATQLCERLVGISRDELKQSELYDQYGAANPLRLFLGDVRDERRMQEAFKGVDTVVHAAALKRVDAGAYNPVEMTRTNIDGTVNVIRAAAACGVRKVLVISSDKACEPLNIYGATKLMAEQMAVSMNAHVLPQGTRVAALRYGNVLGSRGSVAHIWRRQAALGAPLTVTSTDMTRFVLTIEQAVSYAFEAMTDMEGGEVFVPILPSARMLDLAEAVVGEPREYRVTGLRDGGEKLAEALLTVEEPWRTVRRGDRFYVVTPSVAPWRNGGWWGERVDAKLRYVSDGSHGWATVDQLKRLVKEAGL